MFSITLDNTMLSKEERRRFAGFLSQFGVDEAVWEVYACFLRTSTKATQPCVLRVYQRGELVGAAFVARCTAYGKSLFRQPFLHAPIDLVGLPSFIWIRVGFGAEVLANPGFVAHGCGPKQVVKAMIDYLCQNSYGVMIVDKATNADLHGQADAFRYVSDGIVNLHDMNCAQDFVDAHRNIKRKIKHFTNKGGVIDVVRGQLDRDMLRTVTECIQTTAAKSVIHSPFQDGFPHAALETCKCPSEQLVHLIARMNGEVLGYHSFLETGRSLRMLHGAFDRTRRTTHHSYENLIIAAVEYGLNAGLDAVHFGPILNETKRRMMNHAEPSVLYFHCSNPLMRFIIPRVFPYTRMQSKQLLAFAE